MNLTRDRGQRWGFIIIIVEKNNFLSHPSEINWNTFKNLASAGGILPGSSAASKFQHGGLWGSEWNMVEEQSASCCSKLFDAWGFVLEKQNKLGNIRSLLSLDLVTSKELGMNKLCWQSRRWVEVSSLNSRRPQHLVQVNSVSFGDTVETEREDCKKDHKLLSGYTYLFPLTIKELRARHPSHEIS